ncbi:hypothetical protein OSB04_031333 [Centaurea solstitialis]|uniref:Uncharacterized protein n=1 Tax=Centaurea solstitialis TaxID=347529 RepID=A0AA38SLZ0_9ASTR|nr:hypothetical protein OSB04_031333 [Centaurea solstitialis]
MGGGVWNSGWRDGCTLDEVEEVMLDLEKILLSKLIDDMLMELTMVSNVLISWPTLSQMNTVGYHGCVPQPAQPGQPDRLVPAESRLAS